MPVWSVIEIETAWRKSGSGICVIVEGETEYDDPWYYTEWFDYLKPQVKFFHQDGWLQVVDAVTELRLILGKDKVYGILDRDFETPVYDPFPADGLVRTHKYTLENYLLQPDIWFQVIAPTIRRLPRPGWETIETARATITELYRACIPLAAYNWVQHTAKAAAPAMYQGLPDRLNAWASHPDTLTKWGDVDARLLAVQTHMGLADDLRALFRERQTYLAALPLAELEEYVTGKPVLTLLKTSLQRDNKTWNDLLSAYMYHFSPPPTDLQALIEAILANAHA